MHNLDAEAIDFSLRRFRLYLLRLPNETVVIIFDGKRSS